MKLLRFLSVLAASFLLVGTGARGAVGISVSPSVISNDYRGVITLNITGLNVGQSVRVEKFADFNQNGVFDPGIGEALFQSFVLTDGVGSPVFAGVTNVNVPGDGDGLANGVIAAQLRFETGTEANRAAGRFGFRVVNPGGPTLLASAVLTVNQAEQAQRITGMVRAVGGGELTNAFVYLLAAGRGDFLAGVLSDATGAFSIKVPVGSYMVNASRPGFVTLFNQSATVTVGTGQTVLAGDITLPAATRTVSGRITDATTAQGVAGLQVTSGEGAAGFALVFSDTNGNYALPVLAGDGALDISLNSLGTLGLVGPANKSSFTGAGDVAGLNVALARATALLYGRVTNQAAQAVSGVPVEVGDATDSVFQAAGQSVAADGSYIVGVVAGALSFGVDADGLASRGLLPSPLNQRTGTVTVGGALQVNLGVVPPAAHLRGRLVDQGGGGVAGVSIYASPEGGGDGSGTMTDGDGRFDLGVSAGRFYVGASSEDLATRSLLGSQLTVTVADGVNQEGLLLVALPANRRISGRVLGGATGLANVDVYASLMVNGTNFNASARTDGAGQYSLLVFGATWSVNVDSGDLIGQGFAAVNNRNVPVGGSDVTGIDFNASAPVAYLRGQVRDENNNPIADVNLFASLEAGGGSFNGRSDATGSFSIGVGSAGTYRLGLSADVSARNLIAGQWLTLTVVNGDVQTGLVLRVRTATRRITGRLTGNGAAVVGADVYAYATVGGETFNANTQTDGNGQFSLTVFDATWQVGVSGQDLSNRGLPGVNDRAVTVAGADAVVDIIIISNPSRPTLQVRPRVGGLFQVRILGQAGPRYLLQSSTSLLPGQWSTVIDTNSPSASFDVVDPNSGAGQVRKFYRVTVTP